MSSSTEARRRSTTSKAPSWHSPSPHPILLAYPPHPPLACFPGGPRICSARDRQLARRYVRVRLLYYLLYLPTYLRRTYSPTGAYPPTLRAHPTHLLYSPTGRPARLPLRAQHPQQVQAPPLPGAALQRLRRPVARLHRRRPATNPHHRAPHHCAPHNAAHLTTARYTPRPLGGGFYGHLPLQPR